MQGESLVPLLAGKKKPWREALLFEYHTDRVFPRIRNMGYRAVRSERWKLIQYQELQDADELYDLKNDPYELNNVIASSAEVPKLKMLLAGLDRKFS
jgi:arylsulfatase A-like enzyme